MDFTAKCIKSGFQIAAIPVKVAALLPLKAAAWLAPDFLLYLINRILITENMDNSPNPKDKEGVLKFITSSDFIFMSYKMQMTDIWKKSIKGSIALDANVYDLATSEWVNLLSLAKPGRPMVLNFGSCT